MQSTNECLESPIGVRGRKPKKTKRIDRNGVNTRFFDAWEIFDRYVKNAIFINIGIGVYKESEKGTEIFLQYESPFTSQLDEKEKIIWLIRIFNSI